MIPLVTNRRAPVRVHNLLPESRRIRFPHIENCISRAPVNLNQPIVLMIYSAAVNYLLATTGDLCARSLYLV